MESETSHGRSNLYSVHVSNIPINVTADALRDLFKTVGDVVEVYMAHKLNPASKFTYAFVRYKTQTEVQKACVVMNNVKIENSKINVSLSIHTRERVTGTSYPLRNCSKSIMRPPLPRLERNRFTVLASDERHLHQKLKASLNCLNSDPEVSELLGVKSVEDVKDFMKDLKDVLVSISNVPFGVGVDPINFGAEKMQKCNLEEIIIRYHDPSKYEVPFKDIDIDISGNNLLSLAERSRLFPCLPDASSDCGLQDEEK